MLFRHSMEALLNPFFLALILLTLMIVASWKKGNSRYIQGGFLAVLVLFLFLSTGWLAESLTRKFEDQYPIVLKVDPKVHWVVVLSGGQSGNIKGVPVNSILHSASIKRLIEGLRLYRQLPDAKLLLSGGGYGFEIPEASHLAELASWFAIPENKIILETKSLNTADQARAIKQIIKEEPFYLVTSAIHMPRSMMLCKREGLHPLAAPTDFTFYWNDERWAKTYFPNPHNLYYLSVAMHELLGRVWAKIHK